MPSSIFLQDQRVRRVFIMKGMSEASTRGIMTDHSRMKLGRHGVRHDPRTLKFGRYLRPGPPPPKVAVDWSSRVSEWGMMMNDQLRDCTCAAAGHLIEVWTA